MNVIFACYREWAYNIFIGLQKLKHPHWNIVSMLTPETFEFKVNISEVPMISTNPNKLHAGGIQKKIQTFSPDVFLFYGWSWNIPKEYYGKYPCIILHPSALPKYRGGSPIQHQIIRGERKSAVSLVQAGEKLDAGPLYSQTYFSLSGNLSDIFEKITSIGIKDTNFVLNKLATNTMHTTKQDEAKITYFRRRTEKESEISLRDLKNKSAKELYDFIRALQDPYPNAYITCKDGKKLYITRAKVQD